MWIPITQSSLAGLDASSTLVQEQVGSRPLTLVLPRNSSGIGDVRLLSIPATLKQCRRMLTDLAVAYGTTAPHMNSYPSVRVVVERSFNRIAGVEVALSKMHAWVASVMQYRGIKLCHTMGVLLDLIIPGVCFSGVLGLLTACLCVSIALLSAAAFLSSHRPHTGTHIHTQSLSLHTCIMAAAAGIPVNVPDR